MATATSIPNTNLVAIKPDDTSYKTIESYLLSDLPLQSETLLFGLDFKYTKIDKKGFIARMRKQKHVMDIDISCVLFNSHLDVIDTIWFKNLRDETASIRHHGDSLNGKDRGDEAQINRSVDVETIELRLEKLPQNVSHIVLLVSSYDDYPLNSVERGEVTVGDDEGNHVYSKTLSTLNTDASALCLATLSRELGEWRLTFNNLVLKNSDMTTMIEQAQQELSRYYSTGI